jgi:hypothetical protein
VTRPLFAHQTRWFQAGELTFPLIYGALTGWLLGIAAVLYTALMIGAVVLAVGGGYEHVGMRAGALRGAVGGATFGLAVVAVHALSGLDAKIPFPQPAIVFAVLTTILGTVCAAFGGAARQAAERSRAGD